MFQNWAELAYCKHTAEMILPNWHFKHLVFRLVFISHVPGWEYLRRGVEKRGQCFGYWRLSRDRLAPFTRVWRTPSPASNVCQHPFSIKAQKLKLPIQICQKKKSYKRRWNRTIANNGKYSNTFWPSSSFLANISDNTPHSSKTIPNPLKLLRGPEQWTTPKHPRCGVSLNSKCLFFKNMKCS